VTWHTGPMLAVDTETTGVNVEDDRVVTASVVILDNNNPVTISYLINPGVEIPAEATAVHGVTNEQAQRDGMKPAQALEQIVAHLASSVAAQTPIVGMNVAFDLTILDRDCRRHEVKPLVDRVPSIAPVIDVMVIDKQLDRYRKGKRQLTALCEAYGVRHDGAHESGADALAAARVAWAIGNRAHMEAVALTSLYGDRKHPGELVRAFHALGRLTVEQLHEQQVRWFADQSENFRQYLRREANETRHRADRATTDEDRAIAAQEAAELEQRIDGVSDIWPMRPYRT
jgi:DNA polymerase III subunit epsilon